MEWKTVCVLLILTFSVGNTHTHTHLIIHSHVSVNIWPHGFTYALGSIHFLTQSIVSSVRISILKQKHKFSVQRFRFAQSLYHHCMDDIGARPAKCSWPNQPLTLIISNHSAIFSRCRCTSMRLIAPEWRKNIAHSEFRCKVVAYAFVYEHWAICNGHGHWSFVNSHVYMTVMCTLLHTRDGW